MSDLISGTQAQRDTYARLKAEHPDDHFSEPFPMLCGDAWMVTQEYKGGGQITIGIETDGHHHT